jgi:hypothetical protein
MDHNEHCHTEPSGPKVGRMLQIVSGIFLIVLFGYALNIFVVA